MSDNNKTIINQLQQQHTMDQSTPVQSRTRTSSMQTEYTLPIDVSPFTPSINTSTPSTLAVSSSTNITPVTQSNKSKSRKSPTIDNNKQTKKRKSQLSDNTSTTATTISEGTAPSYPTIDYSNDSLIYGYARILYLNDDAMIRYAASKYQHYDLSILQQQLSIAWYYDPFDSLYKQKYIAQSKLAVDTALHVLNQAKQSVNHIQQQYKSLNVDLIQQHMNATAPPPRQIPQTVPVPQSISILSASQPLQQSTTHISATLQPLRIDNDATPNIRLDNPATTPLPVQRTVSPPQQLFAPRSQLSTPLSYLNRQRYSSDELSINFTPTHTNTTPKWLRSASASPCKFDWNISNIKPNNSFVQLFNIDTVKHTTQQTS